MTEDLESKVPTQNAQQRSSATTCQSIDWYHEGQSRIVDVDGIRVTVRFIGRKGRRARIAITGPAGAVFRAVDSNETDRSPSPSLEGH
jgi:hypothetical protein